MANAQTVVVGTVVTDVFPSSYGAALTVQNSGTVTVFLGDATGMNVATGFPLSPGSTIVWDAGRPLYAVVASGTGQVTVLANSGSLNDVSAIATAIIDAGLANDIADRIALVGVPINQGVNPGGQFTPDRYINRAVTVTYNPGPMPSPISSLTIISSVSPVILDTVIWNVKGHVTDSASSFTPPILKAWLTDGLNVAIVQTLTTIDATLDKAYPAVTMSMHSLTVSAASAIKLNAQVIGPDSTTRDSTSEVTVTVLYSVVP